LTERHEALAGTVELLTAEIRDLTADVQALTAESQRVLLMVQSHERRAGGG
jgi:hypothetical protein